MKYNNAGISVTLWNADGTKMGDFDTMSKAAKAIESNRSLILNCLRNPGKTARGYFVRLHGVAFFETEPPKMGAPNGKRPEGYRAYVERFISEMGSNEFTQSMILDKMIQDGFKIGVDRLARAVKVNFELRRMNGLTRHRTHHKHEYTYKAHHNNSRPT